jgi:leucyl aminopeptidase
MSFASEEVYISLDQDTIEFYKKKYPKSLKVVEKVENIALARFDKRLLLQMSHHMHEKFHRCGGYVMHANEKAGMEHLFARYRRSWAKSGSVVDYSISRESLVQPLLGKVEESKIRSVIKDLSSFKNRYYNSKSGVDSSRWIAKKWEDLSKHRSDVKVELIPHAQWKQESIMLTIQGQVDESIVIGGHVDSIAGYFGAHNSTAPGADDNASGVATFTEIMRVLVNSNYKPYHTIKFIGYAAEEVGLRGSSEIAMRFRQEGRDVRGVLQLDMTNFKGSKLDIVLMEDFTNKDQNAFLGALIDKYLPGVSWGYDRCGYACSDHASWHNEGFPASIPFESKTREMNKKIHTRRDRIDVSGGTANHAHKFARLGLAYVIELDAPRPGL